MSSHIDTALVQQALEMALGRRRPSAGLVPHSDRGSQYASQAYRNLLADHGIGWSMRGKGDCLDNAVAERFFGSLQREWTSHGDYATRQEAKDDSIAYIEMFYNSRRKHSYLGYVSPNEYEKCSLVASLCVLFPLTITIYAYKGLLVCVVGQRDHGIVFLTRLGWPMDNSERVTICQTACMSRFFFFLHVVSRDRVTVSNVCPPSSNSR
jgi:hypothetical protein